MGAREYKDAETLRRLFLAHDHTLEQDASVSIDIIVAAKCYGQLVADIDLILAIRANPPRSFPGYPRPIAALVATMELKAHGSEDWKRKGDDVYVRYGAFWKNASAQAEKQMYGLRAFIEDETRASPGWMFRVLWLTQSTGNPDCPLPPHVVGCDLTLEMLMAQFAFQDKYANSDKAFGVGKEMTVTAALLTLTRELKPSPLDRQRIERITKRVTRDQKYAEKLGEQLLLFRGRAGTGKTMQLLRLASELYEDRESRVLVLTYNRALVSDLTRLLKLMAVNTENFGRKIQIRGVHDFLGEIMLVLGLITSMNPPFAKNFEPLKVRLLETLKRDGLSELVTNTEEEFRFDFILIDEGQDWPADERDILFRLYDFRRFIIADGHDQLVRGRVALDWRETIKREHSQVVPLRKVLRMKLALCTFARSFSEHLKLGQWDIEPNQEIHGGRVVVLEGRIGEQRQTFDRIIAEVRAEGNEPVDILMCVPPSQIERTKSKENDYYNSVGAYLGKALKSWDYDVWDGTDTSIRRSYPSRLEQIRIVQYDSCRGLEGWAVFCSHFDSFYDFKHDMGEKEVGNDSNELFYDPEKARQEFVARWLMIAATRPINTLFIHVESSDHPLTQILRNVAAECGPEIVAWYPS